MTVALKYCPHGCGFRTLSLRALQEHEESHPLTEPVEPEPDRPSISTLLLTAANVILELSDTIMEITVTVGAPARDPEHSAMLADLVSQLSIHAALAETR